MSQKNNLPIAFFRVLVCSLFLVCSSCTKVDANDTVRPVEKFSVTDPTKAIPITENTFVCLEDMHAIRGFFVSNLVGKLDDTVAAAKSSKGAVYPPGSVVQLVPTEVMIKHNKGWNIKTNDWEFFELDVSEEGSKIKVRGTTQVVNKFDGNCVECHQKAESQWDFICEEGHGCDSLPIPDFVIRWTQRSDPRCD